ncbi:hypothetical protein DFJ77DRAFT_345577 [Powellomyces hirtus]|nr:hypothetical protein DFJ77DRAFT_345577 [Powellomyces hirtus]
MASEIHHPPHLAHLFTKSHTAPLPTLPTTSRPPSTPTRPRHSTCLDPPAHSIGPGQAGATPLVVCSRGPARDPRAFYSTAYSTTHNTKYWNQGPNVDGGGAAQGYGFQSGAGMKTPSMMRKDRTGFAYNVSPFVEYDKNVDEGPKFNIKNPFGTSHQKHYQQPTVPTPSLAHNTTISSLPDSGFTRMPPKFSVVADYTKPTHLISEMKQNYDARRLHYKPTQCDKYHTIPSGSAYVSNEGEIRELGAQGVPDDRFKNYPPPPPAPARSWQSYNTTRMDEDGYTRSVHGNILQSSMHQGSSGPTYKTHRAAAHDPPRWMEKVDPQNIRSTSSLFHSPKHPLLHTLRALHDTSRRGVLVGSKEAQGSVRNNPVYLVAKAADPAQYSTETGDRFTAQTHVPAPTTFTDQAPQATGFTRGNKYAYVTPAENRTPLLTAQQACARKHANRGVCTVKPTQQIIERGVARKTGPCAC